ncbi:hypothetical protein J4462_04450 [Candidatus Pacearchaeota archaeon]|nr:hypothetical protein [Candidatus Pacearchaeota archaeon]
MTNLKFDSQGRFIGVDQQIQKFEHMGVKPNQNLKTSSDLEFLKDSQVLQNIYERDYWSLYEQDKSLRPLRFSNGKTQEDVVKEIVSLIEKGKKVIFLHGVCGTGKSAIALNIARSIGRASIIVPVKALQKQYEADYMGKKYVLKKGKKMKIAMITGRDNHDSIIKPGKSCADPFLPDTIKITEKNREHIKRYYQDNPYISNQGIPQLSSLKRISIAPSNPYWSPILPAKLDIRHFKDAEQHSFTGINGQEYIFYHRKKGCSYYDQYLAYFTADIIIFNSAKYLAEVSLGRKPQTEVEIIDECDEFLDSFSNNTEINLTRLESSLRSLVPERDETDARIKKIRQLINLEEVNKRAIGVDENQIFPLKETKIGEIISLLSSDPELEAEIQLDEMNYANQVLEAARDFLQSKDETFLTYRKEDDFLYAKLVNINLAKKFKEITDGSKSLVLMSGTLHSPEVLKHIYGIEDYALVEAETLNQGSMEISRVGNEFDCRYANLQSNPESRERYLKIFDKIIENSEKPALIHVNAFSDLPSEEESQLYNLKNVVTREELRKLQLEDKHNERILRFKEGKILSLFTTKCSRGMDFPGNMCLSVIFTKFPNPNVKDTFWKILQKIHPDYYWELYRDKARREFLQRLYRAIRSKHDHVFVLSPDIRVLNAVRKLQENEW